MNTTSHNKSFWHASLPEEIFKKLNATTEGLNELEVAKRQREFGFNRLPGVEPPGLFDIFLSQFKNPLIYVLLVAAVIAFFLNEYTDAGFIFLVLLLNASIGSFQEWKAEKSAAALQKLLKVLVKARRNGQERIIEAEQLVPGDIVFLESGNRVAADLRIVTSNELRMDESLLTGESIAVNKQQDAVEAEMPLGDRTCMAYAGSTVMSGRAKAVVVETGYRTEVGNIARTVTVSTSLKPPLVIRMERFAKQVALVVLGLVVFLAFLAALQDIPHQEIFFFALALAVSAIPEGLPVAITVALAISTNRMATKKVIIRKLTAVEGLGSCTFIASDKTGTLTVNKQTIKRILLPSGKEFEIGGEGYHGTGAITDIYKEPVAPDTYLLLHDLAATGSICNEGSLQVQKDGDWLHQGDAVDIAFLALAYKFKMVPREVRSSLQILRELPFESERKLTATLYSENGSTKVAIKGAVETILGLCKRMITENGSQSIEIEKIEAQALALTSQGYRVLALAKGDVDNTLSDHDWEQLNITGITYQGMVGLIDPLRPEVKEAVARCKQAGIDVGIVTGDHPLTALAIARELGIANEMEQVVTGKELASYGHSTSEEFINVVKDKRVFARVSPLQKMHIVEALNAAGHFVAVTGDGVNDVPALKKAHIGVAMGSGTDLAKETADILITDDNFATLEAGIEGGRFAYDNIRKVTYLLISTGVAEIILFILSISLGLPLPLVAVQLLWLNLVTNGIQDVALAFEKGEPETMKRPPRNPKEGVFNHLMIKQTLVSGLTVGLVSFLAWQWMLAQGYSQDHARTLVLMLMVFLENVHVFNCRSEYKSAFKVPLNRNWVIVGGVLLAQGLHILATNIPLTQRILHTDSVRFDEWLILFALSLSVLLVMELFKIINKKEML